MKTRKPYDTLPAGFIPGLLIPVAGLAIFWSARYHGGFFEFLGDFQRLNTLSKILSLATIPNLLLFFIFIWTDRTFSARGVIFATLVLALVMLVLKFA
ncbi:MAG: hypothetical protein EHM46_02735 [Bacteroidetes bacterium]|nr:MAG: hypothetical protein EHM46_02735 [Bacteroidota bacterium]